MSKWPHRSGRLAVALALVAYMGMGWYAYGFLNMMAATVGAIIAGFVVGNATTKRS